MKKVFILLLSILSLQVFAQRTITGLVKDQQGQPLPGASIVVKGTTTGTVSDIDGKYSLSIPAKATTLVFHCIGYLMQEVPIGVVNVIDIVFQEDGALLQEVVITGYSIQTKRQTTGAVSTVTEHQMMNRVAGVSATPRKKGLFRKNKQPKATKEVANQPQDPTEKSKENGFLTVKEHALSTFSIDVDRAAYANVRRSINANQLPPQADVRVEEMINYFDYKYPQPQGKDPLSISTELADCPWNKDLKLLHVGLQALTVPTNNLPASNLVFLIDVSGSMEGANKLDLVIASFKLLVNQLRAKDKVAIVVYS